MAFRSIISVAKAALNNRPLLETICQTIKSNKRTKKSNKWVTYYLPIAWAQARKHLRVCNGNIEGWRLGPGPGWGRSEGSLAVTLLEPAVDPDCAGRSAGQGS